MSYQTTLALKDDPFAPKWEHINEQERLEQIEYLANLEIEPLRVDQNKLVEDLYCRTISSFDLNESKFIERLEGLGYTRSPPKRSVNSAIMLVRGDAGYGKTTLASRFMKLLAEIVPDGGSKWNSVEITFHPKELGEELSANEIKSEVENKRKEICAMTPGTHTCVLIDDVTTRSAGYLISFFYDLKKYPKIFLMTTQEPQLLTNNTKIKIYDFAISDYEANDAVEYARFRIDRFRDPKRLEIDQVSRLFPFTEEAVRFWVNKTSAEKKGQPLNLRVLNTCLSERIVRSNGCYTRNGRDVSKMTPAELNDLLNECMSPNHNCAVAPHG